MAIRPQNTLNDVKALAAQLGVTFTHNRDSFDLEKSAPVADHGTYPNNQAGINAAFSALVQLQDGERQIAQLRRSIRRDRSLDALGALALSLLAALVAYAVGTFAPQTRGITGPLTLLCMALIVISGCMLLFGCARK
jgi:hypothetical protein